VVAGGYRCGLPAGARAATGPDRRARLPGQRAATWFRAPRQGLPPPQPHHFRHQRLSGISASLPAPAGPPACGSPCWPTSARVVGPYRRCSRAYHPSPWPAPGRRDWAPAQPPSASYAQAGVRAHYHFLHFP
jgi:hypothetical protein